MLISIRKLSWERLMAATQPDNLKDRQMQKIDRNQLANVQIAGGNCAGATKTTTTNVDVVPR